jgi:hypothetical protein
LSSTRPANHHPPSLLAAALSCPAFSGQHCAREGIAQRVPDDELDAPRAIVTDVERRQIRRKPVLGGLINEYTHAA